MKKLKIALIGAGFIADYHARALQKLPNVTISAVAALPLSAAKKFAAKYAISEMTTNASDLTDNPDVDAVVIGTPNQFHAPFALAAMKKGKDVFIEKPLAMNISEGEKIVNLARKNGCLVMVGHMWRFDTEVNFIRKVVSSGRMGDIFKTKGFGIHENWGPDGWFTQKSLAGGGALADMGVHAIDTVRYLLAEPRPVEVYAKLTTRFGNYDVDDTGIVIITWDNSCTSIIESGWWHPHVDGPESATRIFGTKGYASLFPTYLKFKMAEVPGEFTVPMPARQEHCDQIIYDRQMAHFIQCIRKRKEPKPGLEEGMTVLKILEAAYHSSESGTAVMLA